MNRRTVSLALLSVILAFASCSREDEAVTAAQQVRACITLHGLSQAHDETMRNAPTPDFTIGAEFSETIIADCDWPPPPGSDPDGFSRIKVTTVIGPGEGEVTGESFVDRIASPCRELRLQYEFIHMAPPQLRPAFTVKRGTITTVDVPDEPWPGEFTDLGFSPEHGEVDVLRNGRNTLVLAACAS